jgi:FHA domain
MKVQLIVVQGKPEGKAIPLPGPTFRIGRGDSCHLRPNSEQVSREHAEFTITGDKVVVRDLGSRNGTLVNGTALTAPYTLKDRDLIQIGPLSFAISIEGAPVTATRGATTAPAKPPSPDDVTHDEIESWLVADQANPTPDRPSGVYSGDTQTFSAFRGGTTPKPETPAASKPDTPAASKPGTPAPAEPTPPAEESKKSEVVFDRLPVEDAETKEEMDLLSDGETSEAPTEEFVDESNPFYAAKKQEPKAPPVKPPTKDSSDAASDILKRMMDRRRGSR